MCAFPVHSVDYLLSSIEYLYLQFRHAAEMNKKQNDIESLKELLYTYEKTMEHKDNIITNMTKAIQKQVSVLQW